MLKPMNGTSLKHTQTGMSLLEVMVAVVVFSIGLLGVGALMTSAIRGNHTALQRTTAQTLASSMEARMARNSLAIWRGQYNGTYSGGGGGVECDTQFCVPAMLAAADGALWGQQIADALPGGSGSIACVANAVLPAGIVLGNPPYSGVCQLTISWTELGDEGSDDPTTVQTFVHNTQP